MEQHRCHRLPRARLHRPTSPRCPIILAAQPSRIRASDSGWQCVGDSYAGSAGEQSRAHVGCVFPLLKCIGYRDHRRGHGCIRCSHLLLRYRYHRPSIHAHPSSFKCLPERPDDCTKRSWYQIQSRLGQSTKCTANLRPALCLPMKAGLPRTPTSAIEGNASKTSNPPALLSWLSQMSMLCKAAHCPRYPPVSAASAASTAALLHRSSKQSSRNLPGPAGCLWSCAPYERTN